MKIKLTNFANIMIVVNYSRLLSTLYESVKYSDKTIFINSDEKLRFMTHRNKIRVYAQKLYI